MDNMIELLDAFAGKGALSDGYNEAKSEFFRGESATWLMGCWIGGDLEPNQVDLEIDYWPIPSMTGKRPTFVTGSYMQTGWAVTTSATGEKLDKAMAVMAALYDPRTYQTWLNAENMLATASSVANVEGPVSDWPATQYFTESMKQSYAAYGATRGYYVADNDQPPVGMDVPMKQVMQEILTGNRDLDALLSKLDSAWESLRKAEASSKPKD
jgi:ABC-type glycerol-3-phosphate transport system substrate-binding protein